jgi:hypothetical protein
MISLPTVDALDSIAIPIACPVPWDAMRGDHRTRFCDKCSQHVHDVSELTRAEAIDLVTSGEKVPCLRIYRRPDGRVMTADCTTKRELVWKWLNHRAPWLAAVFALVFLAGCNWIPGVRTTGEPIPKQPQDEPLQSVVGGATVEAAKNEGTAGGR